MADKPIQICLIARTVSPEVLTLAAELTLLRFRLRLITFEDQIDKVPSDLQVLFPFKTGGFSEGAKAVFFLTQAGDSVWHFILDSPEVPFAYFPLVSSVRLMKSLRLNRPATTASTQFFSRSKNKLLSNFRLEAFLNSLDQVMFLTRYELSEFRRRSKLTVAGKILPFAPFSLKKLTQDLDTSEPKLPLNFDWPTTFVLHFGKPKFCFKLQSAQIIHVLQNGVKPDSSFSDNWFYLAESQLHESLYAQTLAILLDLDPGQDAGLLEYLKAQAIRWHIPIFYSSELRESFHSLPSTSHLEQVRRHEPSKLADLEKIFRELEFLDYQEFSQISGVNSENWINYVARDYLNLAQSIYLEANRAQK